MPALQPLPPRKGPRLIAPAPPAPRPHQPHGQQGKTTFYNLPPEIRVEIFKLVIADVKTYITPVSGDVPPSKKRKFTPDGTPSPPSSQPPQTNNTNNRTNHSQPNPSRHVSTTAQQHPPPISNIHTLLSPPTPLEALNYYHSTSTSHATSPPTTTTTYHSKPRTTPRPHALTLTASWLRNEALPLIHERCPIHARIVDFDFSPLLTFLSRIPPEHQHKLLKNPTLEIELVTTVRDGLGGLENLRKWLHVRADECRPQAKWRYVGERPGKRIVNDLRRRVRRMKEVGKRREFERMLEGLGIDVNGSAGDD